MFSPRPQPLNGHPSSAPGQSPSATRSSSHPAKRVYTLLTLIFLSVSIAIGIAGYLFSQKQKERLKEEKWEELSAIADLKVTHIVNWRRQRLGDAAVISDSPFIGLYVGKLFDRPGDAGVRQLILKWMETRRKNYGYRDILLMDKKGVVRLAVSEKKGAVGPSGKALALEALRSKAVIFSDFHRSEDVREIHLDLLVPIFLRERGKEAPLAVVLLRVDPDQFLYPLVQSWPTPSRTAETLLVRKEGEDVLFLTELRHRKGSALDLRLPISEKQLPAAMAARGQEGIVEGLDYRGVPVLAAMRRIPDTPWHIVSKVDQEEIYASIRSQSRNIAILAGVLIFGTAVSLFFLWRRQRSESEKTGYLAEVERLTLTQRLDHLSRHANDIFLLMDTDLNIVEANDRAMESYGYSRDELLRMGLKDLRSPEAKSFLPVQEWKVEEGSGFVYEAVHQRKDGSTFTAEASSRVFEVDGKTFYQEIIRDITERKKVEELFRISEKKFSKVFYANPSWVALATFSEGRFIEVNERFLEMTGFRREEVIGRTSAELGLWVVPEERGRMLSLLKGQNGLRDYEVMFRAKTGNLFQALWSGELIEMNGEVLHPEHCSGYYGAEAHGGGPPGE